MTKILFVCSGNVFRSLSAERALRSVLPPDSGIEVSSAGTIARPEKPIRPDVVEALARWGVDVSDHKPRRLTREILEETDLVVAMNTDHQKFIADNFGLRVPLYMDVVNGSGLPFPDLPDVLPDYKRKENEDAAHAFVNASVDRIFRFRDAVAARLPLFLPPPPAAGAAPSGPSPN
jgi:protein-tyrosine phosphatase